MELYHGSNVEVQKPKILANGFYKDFGYGFYCTKIKKQAERWALTKKGNHVINGYIYNENKTLNILKFSEMTEEWLDFIVDCRSGINHSYDIVEGPMADDTIWDYIEDFIRGNITREAFWVLVKFKYPTHQIVFCTEKSLEMLNFEGSYSL
ncbi:MAG: DUF3990 domain-containing protein [Lachnospiraceae bacterium]|nr:DUF3990 domain-containing protein [Lachnospiraceae bacterium]